MVPPSTHWSEECKQTEKVTKMKIFSNLNPFKKREAAGSGQNEAGDQRTPRQGGNYPVEWLIPAGGGEALKVATVYRCINIISESVANLPLQYLKKRGGLFADQQDSPLAYLLNVQPDGALSAYDFWTQLVRQVLMDGNAYVVPFYDYASMEPCRLALCGRNTVRHDTLADRYTVSDALNGISGTWDENEIIHIKNFSLDGKRGIGTLAYAAMTAGIAVTGDRETLKRFATGGHIRGIVRNDSNSVRGFGEYQDDELKRVALDLDKQFKGGTDIVSMNGEIDFKQLSMNSTDMQFQQVRGFTVREICRFFGVHPSFVFDDTSNNYKSAEMANVAFLSNTLDPLLKKIESELNRKLIAGNLAGRQRIRFDRRGLYSCDLESRADYQAKTIAAGLYTVNEWRAEENKAPVAGGDKVLVSANLRTLDETTGGANKTNINEGENG